MNTWIASLKIWNSEREGNYSVPRKGSKEYDEVKSIQNKMINGDGLKQLGTGAHTKKTKSKKKTGGQIIDPNIDLIEEIDNLFGSGVAIKKKRGRPKKKKGKGVSLGELSAVNSVLYPLQPKLPSLDTRTGKPVPPSTPFDFLNIKF